MDVKLYYKEAGKGFPLILLHGMEKMAVILSIRSGIFRISTG